MLGREEWMCPRPHGGRQLLAEITDRESSPGPFGVQDNAPGPHRPGPTIGACSLWEAGPAAVTVVNQA